jgi:hypothetical protein
MEGPLLELDAVDTCTVENSGAEFRFFSIAPLLLPRGANASLVACIDATRRRIKGLVSDIMVTSDCCFDTD